MTRSDAYVALLRGINVGRAKRIAMADLRDLMTALGYRDVHTLLNSGNVVFRPTRTVRGAPGKRIEQAISTQCGIVSRVTILTGKEIGQIVRDNPLADIAHDPARYLVTVLTVPTDSRLEPLERRSWNPDAFVLRGRVGYSWCVRGVLESPLAKAVGKAVGDAGTSRNWGTIVKLGSLVAEMNDR